MSFAFLAKLSLLVLCSLTIPNKNYAHISRMLPWSTCAPRRKIAFAKTHKTASSTVQNILLRYGLANGVEFLLPAARNYLGNMLKPFAIKSLDNADKKNVPWHETLRKTAGGYDITCFHCKWNDTAMR